MATTPTQEYATLPIARITDWLQPDLMTTTTLTGHSRGKMHNADWCRAMADSLNQAAGRRCFVDKRADGWVCVSEVIDSEDSMHIAMMAAQTGKGKNRVPWANRHRKDNCDESVVPPTKAGDEIELEEIKGALMLDEES